MNKILLSHNSDEWETPQDLFDKLDSIFHFDLDVASTHKNAKCKNYFTKADNGLEQDWWGNVWCNPPYSDLKNWLKKAYNECEITKDLIFWCKSASTVEFALRNQSVIKWIVFLCYANTGNSCFHDYGFKADYILFLKGRLKFYQCDKKPSPAPRDSLILFFNGDEGTYFPARQVQMLNLGKLIKIKKEW